MPIESRHGNRYRARCGIPLSWRALPVPDSNPADRDTNRSQPPYQAPRLNQRHETNQPSDLTGSYRFGHADDPGYEPRGFVTPPGTVLSDLPSCGERNGNIPVPSPAAPVIPHSYHRRRTDQDSIRWNGAHEFFYLKTSTFH